MSANMRKHSRRQFQTPSSNYNSSTISTNNNSKWKNDRDGNVDGSKPPSAAVVAAAAITTKNLARPSMRSSRLPPPSPARFTGPVSNNIILAGYLAQEFITKGTLFGEAWESEEGSRRGEKRKLSSSEEKGKEIEKQTRYIEVAEILKGKETHLPGIFNPTQLARFLHMGP